MKMFVFRGFSTHMTRLIPLVVIIYLGTAMASSAGDEKRGPTPENIMANVKETTRRWALETTDQPEELAPLLALINARTKATLRLWEPDAEAQTKKVLKDYVLLAFEKLRPQGNWGDVMRSFIAHHILAEVPPNIVLEAMVPELGQGGRLEGFFERQAVKPNPFQGEPGKASSFPADFDAYAHYLARHKDGEGRRVLIAWMFRVDANAAFDAVISPTWFERRAELRGATLKLVQAKHIIANVIERHQLKLPVGNDSLAEAQQSVQQLAHHKQWWARLYVATVLTSDQVPDDLKSDQLRDRLRQDDDPLVRKAMEAR